MTFLFSLLPDSLIIWCVHLLTLAGIVGYAVASFLGNIPLINNYATPIKLASILALVLGVYFEGSMANEQAWRQKVSELETQIRISEVRAEKANESVRIEYRDRVKVVHDTQVVVQEKIKEIEKVIDAKCEVDPSAIDLLNRAAAGGEKK